MTLSSAGGHKVGTAGKVEYIIKRPAAHATAACVKPAPSSAYKHAMAVQSEYAQQLHNTYTIQSRPDKCLRRTQGSQVNDWLLVINRSRPRK